MLTPYCATTDAIARLSTPGCISAAAGASGVAAGWVGRAIARGVGLWRFGGRTSGWPERAMQTSVRRRRPASVRGDRNHSRPLFSMGGVQTLLHRRTQKSHELWHLARINEMSLKTELGATCRNHDLLWQRRCKALMILHCSRRGAWRVARREN
jgi:hypothetical protein